MSGTTLNIPDPRNKPRLSMTEVADLYGIGLRQAYEGVRRGEIPATRVGGRWIVPTAKVLDQLGLEPPAA